MNSRIGIVEIIIMLLIVIPVDILEAIADFTSGIPILGQIFIIVMWLADPICTFAIGFWLWMKRLKGLWYIAGSMLEWIPGIDALPIRTGALLLTIHLANLPLAEVTKIMQKPGLKRLVFKLR